MRNFFLLILISLLFSSCMTVQTSSDFDKNINFLKLRTYEFYDEGIDKLNLNSLDKHRIIAAVENGLKIKGFVKANHPDVLINIVVVDKELTKSSSGWVGGGYVYDYTASEYRWTSSQWSPNASVKQTTESTIMIDFINPVTKDLMWHGQFKGFRLDNFEKREERMYGAIKQILDQFPPDSSTNQ